MASFQAKIGWKMPGKREYKKYHSVSFQPDENQKIAKKFKNLKNPITASFQAKIGWKRMRKRENRNYHYVSFLPDATFKIPTKQQKNSNH